MGSKHKHASENGTGERKHGHAHSKGKGHSHRNGCKIVADSKTNTKDTGCYNYQYLALVGIIACVISYMGRKHIYDQFESDRHFSHLSNLERELAFRTEMGLYYSYYKTIIEAPSFYSGLHSIMFDDVTEYPLIINTLKRFNLYPEVVLGAAYRVFTRIMHSLNIQTQWCYQVNRGDGYSAVTSCDGIGDPAYFYVEAVFFLNGLSMGMFFLFGTYLSENILGGLVTTVCWFYNHGESTRVQWTPPLRESFSFPFIFVQIYIITHLLRQHRPNKFVFSPLIAMTTVISMLSWQFAQFAFVTQLLAVFATYMLGYIGSYKMKIVVMGQAMGLSISFMLLFGNMMLLGSFFATGLITILVILHFEQHLEKLKVRLLILLAQGALLLFGMLTLKSIISRVLSIDDDAHIIGILKSKFSDYKSFDTMLYTCAAEFNFLELQTIKSCSQTMIIPMCVLSIIVIAFKTVGQDMRRWLYPPSRTPVLTPTTPNVNGHLSSNDSHAEDSDSGGVDEIIHREKPYAEMVYHVFQLAAFTVMAVLIMRLKLFWTPHMSLLSSLVTSKKLYSWLGPRPRQYALVALLLAIASVRGWQNLQKQWSISGEFSNYPQEELMNWINTQTRHDAAFAGPIPLMATVKLCTKRPIVDHPHYEDVGLRRRVNKVYTIYSRKPIVEVWRHLTDLQVDYLVISVPWCYGRSSVGCGMVDIWDVIDASNRNRPKTCETLIGQDPKPYFQRVFSNAQYAVLKLQPLAPKQ